jgi:two-component system chemotaxis response regulator CheY
MKRQATENVQVISPMTFDPTLPILVVDDYPLVAATIAGLLKAEGFRAVDVAHGGANALAKLAGKSYRLIISDLKMPGMSGLELFDEIRQREDGQDTRFLLITGMKNSGDLDRAKGAGVDAVLAKPFSPETLRETIEGIFLGRLAVAR